MLRYHCWDSASSVCLLTMLSTRPTVQERL